MTRIIHLTDLHFGADRAEMVAPLAAAITASGAEFVAVSGDLTHRARAAQFRQAMRFLGTMGPPFMTVPGNHDIPVFNLFARFALPRWNYRRLAGRDLAPVVQIGNALLIGADTTDPMSWRRGRLRARDLGRILSVLRKAPADLVACLVCHHPLTEPPGFERGETRGADEALPQLAAAGLQLALTGHLHHWAIGLGASVAQPAPILQIQTGTALCGRAGETGHGFSVLDIGAGACRVTPWLWRGRDFLPDAPQDFRRDMMGWRKI